MRMRPLRIRRKIGRSTGLSAFATKRVDYPVEFRTLSESGRTDLIRQRMYVEDTMCGSCYEPIDSIEIWKKIEERNGYSVFETWHEEYEMKRSVEFWQHEYANTSKVYETYMSKGRKFFESRYIPVRWTNNNGFEMQFGLYAQHLMKECANQRGMPFHNYAYYKDKKGHEVLYARVAWLRTFRVGQQLINYYIMARKFNKVYGFGGYDAENCELELML